MKNIRFSNKFQAKNIRFSKVFEGKNIRFSKVIPTFLECRIKNGEFRMDESHEELRANGWVKKTFPFCFYLLKFKNYVKKVCRSAKKK